jgi:hypothetical protein
MTKKVMSNVLDPIIRSTCMQPLVSEGFPAKSFRIMLVGIKSPGPMPSFLKVVYGITLTPSVFYENFFQVVSPLVISFPSGSSQCGANKVKRIKYPGGMQ